MRRIASGQWLGRGMACAATALSAVPAAAQGLPTVPAGFVASVVASNLTRASAMAFAPDGRLFVCLQDGSVRVIKRQRLLSTPFVSLAVDSGGERGLLGIAFDPDFAANQFVYLYYTALTTPRRNRVSRFTASGDVAVAGSEAIIMALPPLSATNHNGGALHFGPDGKLYVAVGENAVRDNAQSLTTRLGKILRLNSDGSIPTDNPFFGSTTGQNRAIWALGLRNPFTFAFDPAGGRMFINDVGAGTFEEINEGVAGANYGWPIHEGPGGDPAYRDPIHHYSHAGTPGGCAIVGAAFHDTARARWPPDYAGDYFYADLCGGWIRRFDAAQATDAEFASGVATPVDLAIGPEGDLYVAARGSGQILRFSHDVIFEDDFESGDLSAWSTAVTDGGDLAVTGAAALGGSFGLEAVVDDQADLYVQDDTPNDEGRYRALFLLHTQGFDPGAEGAEVRLLTLNRLPGGKVVATVGLVRRGAGYGVQATVRLDDGGFATTGEVNVADGPHTIELLWMRSGPDASNGRLNLWVDGTLRGRSGLDNDGAGSIGFARLGVTRIPPGALGSLSLDGFKSRRRTRPVP